MNNNYSSLIEHQFESEDDDMPILPPTDTEQSTGIPIPIL
jgi:hypothetical protein